MCDVADHAGYVRGAVCSIYGGCDADDVGDIGGGRM